MSDNLQMQGSSPHRRSVKTRYATSCTECRRRKQKCNQGQPCTNCVRRFPQPTCEYTTKPIKRPTRVGSSNKPNLQVVLDGEAYSHLDLAEIQDAILQVEGLATAGSPTEVAGVPLSDGNGSPIDSQSSSDDCLKVVIRDETGIMKPRTLLALVQVIMKARLKVTNRILNDEWSINGPELLRAVQQAGRPPAMIGGLDDQLRNLPMAPTRMNIELVRIHLQLLSRFKASLDGNPDPESRFMKHWVPLSIKDPLLLQIVLYTASCFLNETGRIPKMLVWAYKGGVHRMLNDHLSAPKTQISDVAIMGASQMVMDSWYWGTTDELMAHMAGLKTMVKMRGGFQDMGMQGFLAKTALINDIAIAIAHNISPAMYGESGFEFRDEFMVPFQVSFNSPLLSDWPPFLSPGGSSQLHPSTAQILDEMRQILKAIVSLPDMPTPEQEQNVVDAAKWAFGKLNQMPDDVPQYDGGQATKVAKEEDHDTRRDSSNWEGWDDASPSNTSDASTPRDGQHSGYDSNSTRSQTDDTIMSPASTGPPDLIYRCVRMAAAIYYRAILARSPTEEIIQGAEFLQTWDLIWKIGLAAWKQNVGIFIWVMLATVPSCHNLSPARFIKTSMVAGLMTMALENWHVTIDAAEAALVFQRWLRREFPESPKNNGAGVVGGEKMVEKHGFILPDTLPDIVNVTYEESEYPTEADMPVSHVRAG